MYKNYFYLARAAGELNNLLHGRLIHQIYSQEKNKLFFDIGSEDEPYKHLIISCIPHLPYLQIRNNHRKARKNVFHFFREYLPAEIEEITIAESDRVIKFSTFSTDFFFTVRGGSTNFLLVDESDFIPFKRMNEKTESELRNLYALDFVTAPKLPEIPEKIENSSALIELRREHPIIPKDLLSEISAKYQFPLTGFREIFSKTINSIITNDIEIGLLDDRLKWLPSDWAKPDGFETLNINKTYLTAIDYYVSSYYREKKFSSELKSVTHQLDRELEKLSSKLNKLKHRIENGSRELELRKKGELLLSHFHSIQKGEKSAKVEDFQTGEIVDISLRPDLSPKENAEYYFKKSKDERRAFLKSKELFESTKSEYESVKRELERLSDVDNIEQMPALSSKLNRKTAKMDKKNSIPGFKYRKFIIEGKYECFVGRDSKSNDYLSVKFSKQNDYWFHARGLAGSHTLLRVPNPKENVPKSVLKVAASIAAFYSKGKTASIVPVSYTFAKYVYKKKGMEPGQVLISKEKSLLVSPQIPNTAERVED